MTDDDALLAALGVMQTHGAIGEASLEQAIAHAEQFVSALPAFVRAVADLGSGGGLPGLVIAVRCPELLLTLIERRRSRADLLSRMVRALSLGDRVTVVAVDVRVVAAEVPHSFDAVTARSFAAPAITARWAGELLRNGGMLVVSEPPDEAIDRWPVDALLAAGLMDLGREQGVRKFIRL